MAEMDGVEASGRTIDEAVNKALSQLGLNRAQVEVQILSEGRAGLLGIRGSQARVFVRPLTSGEAPPDEEDEFDEDEIPTRPGFESATDADEDEDELDEDQIPTRPSFQPAAGRTATRGRTGTTRPRSPAAPRGQVDGEAIDEAVETLQTLLDLMGLDTEVQARAPQTSGDGAGLVTAVLDVTGEDLGLLIGRRGETLASLQYMLNLIIRRRTHSRLTFGIDVEGYRRRREAMLNGLAHRMADRVRSTGQSLTLEPMPPAERRIVHLALADDPDVLTVSIGEGDARKVAITPRH